ncbi:MAG: RNA polymerase sigma factor [Steroidobacter sp.]
MTNNKNDKTLQQRLANFNLSSTAARYEQRLHRYLVRRLRNPEDVNDLAQEVYMRLLRLDDAKSVRDPLAYLYRVASSVVADFWTGAGREQVEIDNDAVEEWAENPESALPDDLAERLNLQQQLERAIAQLPPTQAAVLVLHKRDGLSYEEVARTLNLSVHTVEKYVTLAKARIRTMTWER